MRDWFTSAPGPLFEGPARVEDLSDAHHLAVGGDNVMIAYLLEIERAGSTPV